MNPSSPSPAGPRILLGVCGSIAAYKAAELVRLLQAAGARPRVLMTRAAQEFIRPLTLEALSGYQVLTDLFPAQPESSAPRDPDILWESSIEHIQLAQNTELLLIAPATADRIARMAAGRADDLLGAVYLATPAPVLLAPAMNTRMWEHPATRENLELLRRRGVRVIEPESGELACGMEGSGRLAAPAAIAAAALAVLAPRRDWAGKTVLITAGPTREALDSMRFISNRSSGRMGYALAAAALARGARVVLISGPVALPAPAAPAGQLDFIPVHSAREMDAAARQAFAACDLAILAAAVADFQPRQPHAGKLPKPPGDWQLDLTPTPDILAGLGQRKQHQLLIGFAAESGAGSAALERARAKLMAKHADAIVFNDISRSDAGLESDYNQAVWLSPDQSHNLPRASKRELADHILDLARDLKKSAGPARAEPRRVPA